MKKNVRNALAISGLALAIGASGFTLDASANTGQFGKIQRSHQERILKTRKVRVEKTIGTRRMTVGTVTSVSENSLTITRGSKTIIINTNAETKIISRNWKTLSLSDIKEGNRIKVSGTISGDIITAKSIRNISIHN